MLIETIVDGDWIEADDSKHYYDALSCDVPLLEGVFYLTSEDGKTKTPMILFTSDGLNTFINEYNKTGNLSGLNEAKFKLNNLSLAKLKETLISEKQFTFVQLNRLSDLYETLGKFSDLFQMPFSYMLMISETPKTLRGYQLDAVLFGYETNQKCVAMALLSNINKWENLDISEY